MAPLADDTLSYDDSKGLSPKVLVDIIVGVVLGLLAVTTMCLFTGWYRKVCRRRSARRAKIPIRPAVSHAYPSRQTPTSRACGSATYPTATLSKLPLPIPECFSDNSPDGEYYDTVPLSRDYKGAHSRSSSTVSLPEPVFVSGRAGSFATVCRF